MAQRRGRLILAVMLIVTVASLWVVVKVERDKREVLARYAELQHKLDRLGGERTLLSGQLHGVRSTLAGQDEEIKKLQDTLRDLHGDLNKTLTELGGLKRDNKDLREANLAMVSKLNAAQAENKKIRERFSSIAELKRAIKDIRIRARRERQMARELRIQTLKEEDQRRLMAGNRGYLVRDGLTTVGLEAKLQIHVLEPQAE